MPHSIVRPTLLIGAFLLAASPAFSQPWSGQRLAIAGGLTHSRFGQAVAIDRNFALVGTPGLSKAAQTAGAAHVFRRSGNRWTLEAELLPEPAIPFGYF